MITDKVLGAYAAVGSLSPGEQADWYRTAAGDWGLKVFEIPVLAGVPMAPELIKALADVSASLVVTCVAQWATKGQGNPAYGLSSLDEACRREAILDIQSIQKQCQSLSRSGVGIRNVAVHTGQRVGAIEAHASAFQKSLLELIEATTSVLPDSELTVEVCDNLPPDHPISFPAAKKQSLPLGDLLDTVASANGASGTRPTSVMLNWGRMLINGDQPLQVVDQVETSDAPLAGVIMSGAGSTPDGFADSHNSHLDPDSGFTAADGKACAAALQSSGDSVFLGMKCSVATTGDALSVEEVLAAEAELLNSI